MLPSQEQAKLLAPYLDQDYFKKQVARLAALRGMNYDMCLALINAQKRSQTLDYNQQQQRLHQALEWLARLPRSDRQRLFAACAPSIANEIEAAWQVFDHLPYPSGNNRRPFRLVGTTNPGESHLARAMWVHRLLQAVKGYEQPVVWFAEWAAYLGYGAPDALGPLFAGAMDQGGRQGQEIFEILTASARGEHPTGRMGRHVVRALLCASRPDGWAFIERMLLAAQREEGLRQVILEASDEAHPDAFLRILHIVIEQNLIRFSAVVRAASVWVGLPFEAATPKTVQAVLDRLCAFLENPDANQIALSNGAPEDQYLALWSIAYRNTARALVAAQPLLLHPEVGHRFAAVYFLNQARLAESERLLLPLIDDADLAIAYYALAGLSDRGMAGNWYLESDLFERVERLIQRTPERTTRLQPVIWEWMTIQFEGKAISNVLVKILGDRSPARLLPYLRYMNSGARVETAKLLAAHVHENPQYREALFTLAADRDSSVHEHVFKLLEKIKPRIDEIPRLEALLTRKSASLRRGVMALLLHQPDADLFASIDRLLEKKDEQQRLAGIELLREMAQANRERNLCQLRVAKLQSKGPSEIEKHLLADLVSEEMAAVSLRDALGLADLHHLSRPVAPRAKNTLFGLIKNIHLGSAAAAACIEALDDLVDQYRTEPVEINDWRNETRTELLGNIRWGFSRPDPNLSMEENRQRFQLAEVWEQWWQARPRSMRDDDGLELLRALAALSLVSRSWSATEGWATTISKEFRRYLDEPYDVQPRYEDMVRSVLQWLAYLHPAPGSVAFLLDAVEEMFFRFGQHPQPEIEISERHRWQLSPARLGYLNLAREHRRLHPETWTAENHARLWGLVCWLEKFIWERGGIFQPDILDIVLARDVQAATQDDLIMHLIGASEESGLEGRLSHLVANNFQAYTGRREFWEFHHYSGKRIDPLLVQHPCLQEAIAQCRDRILEIELRRGDLPTAASIPARALRSVPGADKLIRLLTALGSADFERGAYAYHQDRTAVLSHLVRISYPVETDTPESFSALVRAARISERRLVNLAVFAPQWAAFVAHTIGWQGMVEGVWWIYAHTKDRQWSVDKEIRESWPSQIAEFTPLSADELLDGAVDVDWFHRVIAGLGAKRWQELYRVALYAASGSGHVRARLFADALLGNLTAEALVDRIRSRRQQDAARALGLVPLPADTTRQGEILHRYEVLQEFLRTSKKFGAQRQASEKLAASIGMQNLARSAGYADPQRLEWSMELEAIFDLAGGPVAMQAEGISVTLSINSLGEPELAIQRGEKPLKNLPPALRKNEKISALISRKHALDQQMGRMRSSLETAMVRGDRFRGAELKALLGHPILRVMLEQLIFIGPAGMGYLVENGAALERFGRHIPLADDDALYLAHSYDLLQSGCWHEWQHECFVAERIQPFKQVFRELYLPTRTELDEKDLSRRYSGQQVNPRQSIAVFGSRGWVAAPEEGVLKTFHAEEIVARVCFLQTFTTPAEVDGLTIETVHFTPRGEWQPVHLDLVPPRLFSEVMRDLDLVVSVAHAGGVDPEATASTVEARAALVQETCALLKLPNVRVDHHHAFINGTSGNYTIHLGSGIVHKQPGGALCIVPVHSQHRGRLFLPFVDPDPKTAEILSKVLLFAKDTDIKDPTIIEQIV